MVLSRESPQYIQNACRSAMYIACVYMHTTEQAVTTRGVRGEREDAEMIHR